MLWVIVIAVIVVVLAGILVALYNRLVRLRNRCENAWAQVDVQLRRRYDLIPNLVEAVKGYAAHERETFEEVTKARTAAQQAQGVQEQAQAENLLTQAIGRLFESSGGPTPSRGGASVRPLNAARAVAAHGGSEGQPFAVTNLQIEGLGAVGPVPDLVFAGRDLILRALGSGQGTAELSVSLDGRACVGRLRVEILDGLGEIKLHLPRNLKPAVRRLAAVAAFDP